MQTRPQCAGLRDETYVLPAAAIPPDGGAGADYDDVHYHRAPQHRHGIAEPGGQPHERQPKAERHGEHPPENEARVAGALERSREKYSRLYICVLTL